MSLSRYWYSGFGNFNFVSGVAEKIEIISESATFSRGSNWNYSALSAFSICAHLKWFRRSRINWKKKGCLCDHQSFTLLNFIRSLRNKLKTAHTRRIKLETEPKAEIRFLLLCSFLSSDRAKLLSMTQHDSAPRGKFAREIYTFTYILR